jgi:hypothetical protein
MVSQEVELLKKFPDQDGQKAKASLFFSLSDDFNPVFWGASDKGKHCSHHGQIRG